MLKLRVFRIPDAQKGTFSPEIKNPSFFKFCDKWLIQSCYWWKIIPKRFLGPKKYCGVLKTKFQPKNKFYLQGLRWPIWASLGHLQLHNRNCTSESNISIGSNFWLRGLNWSGKKRWNSQVTFEQLCFTLRADLRTPTTSRARNRNFRFGGHRIPTWFYLILTVFKNQKQNN